MDKFEMKTALIAGCFDLGLHPGHRHILAKAKKLGRLVVATNTDDDIRRRKGEGRPIWTLNRRVNSLLEFADAVFPFSGDNHLEQLIEWIKPQYIVVGSDYRNAKVVGWPDCEAWGGQVVFVDRIPGYSTTEILNEQY